MEGIDTIVIGQYDHYGNRDIVAEKVERVRKTGSPEVRKKNAFK